MGNLIDQDQEHLRLLKIGYYVLSALGAGFTALILVYISVFGVIFTNVIPAQSNNNAPDPKIMGLIFLVIAGVVLLAGAGGAFLTFYAAKSIGERKRWTFVVVVAALCCFQFPVGTAIGVCSIMVMTRPSVKALFGQPVPPPPIPTGY
jgi:hypothetical protein